MNDKQGYIENAKKRKYLDILANYIYTLSFSTLIIWLIYNFCVYSTFREIACSVSVSAIIVWGIIRTIIRENIFD